MNQKFKLTAVTIPKGALGFSFALLLVSWIGGGCDHGSRPDPLGSFLITKLNAYGAKLAPAGKVPEIPGKWRLEEDSNGFQIAMTGGRFEQLDNFFKTYLGEPYISTDRNLSGFRQRVYKLSAAGPVLQYEETKGGAQIICVKGSTQWKP
jgi:hypothetical protein